MKLVSLIHLGIDSKKTTFRCIICCSDLEAHAIIMHTQNDKPVTWHDLLPPGKESLVFIRVYLLTQEKIFYIGGDKKGWEFIFL